MTGGHIIPSTHQLTGGSLPTSLCRPAVCAPDDTSNFEDYSDLEPMTHASELSVVEQASFAGF
jgi:hypothetical protein